MARDAIREGRFVPVRCSSASSMSGTEGTIMRALPRPTPMRHETTSTCRANQCGEGIERPISSKKSISLEELFLGSNTRISWRHHISPSLSMDVRERRWGEGRTHAPGLLKRRTCRGGRGPSSTKLRDTINRPAQSQTHTDKQRGQGSVSGRQGGARGTRRRRES